MAGLTQPTAPGSGDTNTSDWANYQAAMFDYQFALQTQSSVNNNVQQSTMSMSQNTTQSIAAQQAGESQVGQSLAKIVA